MLRSALRGALLTAGLVTVALAQAQPDDAGHCAGLPTFGPRDSLNIADLKVKTKDLRVQVHADGPELHIRLVPDPAYKRTDRCG